MRPKNAVRNATVRVAWIVLDTESGKGLPQIHVQSKLPERVGRRATGLSDRGLREQARFDQCQPSRHGFIGVSGGPVSGSRTPLRMGRTTCADTAPTASPLPAVPGTSHSGT